MAFKIPVADEAIAQVAMTVLFENILSTEVTTEPDPVSVAKKLLGSAMVRFQPSTRRLVLTFDLAMSNSEED
jgi:hypothetical protein